MASSVDAQVAFIIVTRSVSNPGIACCAIPG
jgi:hypothetical protein